MKQATKAPETLGEVREPTTDKPNTKRIRFSVDTRKSRVVKEEDTLETYLEVPISSLSEDRDRDEFSDRGMDSLISQAQSDPVGLFPNHGMDPETANYDFREIFGSLEDGHMDDETAMGRIRLRRVSADSDELVDDAATLVDLVEQDMPVGFSIGFGWDEKDVEERDDGGLRFHDLDLMEVSAVGIPSNPEAVVQAGQAVMAAAKSAGLDETDPSGWDIEIRTNDMTDQTEAEEATELEEEAPDDEEEEEEEQVDETEESEEKDADQAVDTANSIIGIYEGHMEAAREDVSQWLDSEFGEELSGNPDDVEAEENYDDEEEETEASDDEEDEDKVAELQSEIESLRAELETIRTDATTSSERKGGMEPVDAEEVDEQTNGSGEVPETFARNVV